MTLCTLTLYSRPFGVHTPDRSASPALNNKRLPRYHNVSPWLRWAVSPVDALKLLTLPLVLYANWELLAPYLSPGFKNPFAPFFQISGHVDTSDPGDHRYAKSYYDILFLAYHIIFFSGVRQFITINVSRPIAKYFGLKREAKIDRFGEQAYAMVYFAVFGTWGYSVMTHLPTYWYRTEYFWIDYPHWNLNLNLKRYYLMQFSYWCQQLLVLLLGLEKPRKDYSELVAHHFVTLWLVGWSYLFNMTYIGNAVYMSMDIPDTFLAFSKLLNYIQWERAKVISFVIFVGIWTYFRHYLNIIMLWSALFETHLVPYADQPLSDSDYCVYMVSWMPAIIFISIFVLQILNLFWYYLIMKILVRAIVISEVDDDRSDDEDEEGAEAKKED
ncbi:uncharacterized protein LACBIDRAFT_246245 [Laccaria bicolor S238N-H82]|uniref:Predicted protein n=1 Tax=Laccaria bicolor (strain S238N-H82 / ATCC MYA-4686) TaxID=486041 RepID=B0CYI3_LACBS|nr:uncharacterized protein LACBIDRAFT_246245 [Laccaria bicolor S238N-H82]EDR12888.1 predicted protein [Laccaria bicolor S238N-H82]|eukprot:XP_001877152.1 predicted protein [Laccaria bicolor S238N-H82]